MGAESFQITAAGVDATEAFKAAVEQAQYDHGHAGYTGTIAEKDSCIVIPKPEDSQAIVDLWEDERFSDKWGPCACWDTGEVDKDGKHIFMFLGWASS